MEFKYFGEKKNQNSRGSKELTELNPKKTYLINQ